MWLRLFYRLGVCFNPVYSPRGIVAHVHEEVLAEGPSASGTVAHPTAYQMRAGPCDLSVMTDFVQVIVLVVAELVVFVLHVPHSDREIPVIRKIRFFASCISKSFNFNFRSYIVPKSFAFLSFFISQRRTRLKAF